MPDAPSQSAPFLATARMLGKLDVSWMLMPLPGELNSMAWRLIQHLPWLRAAIVQRAVSPELIHELAAQHLLCEQIPAVSFSGPDMLCEAGFRLDASWVAMTTGFVLAECTKFAMYSVGEPDRSADIGRAGCEFDAGVIIW
uniref:Uncharacterized protein n=1 Tax=Arundo donax TaxID=35708 RepID=A0A0A9GCZ2_ARUDO